MKEFIIKIEFGGLGDHLFHTPLPRLLKKYNLADKVFISNQSPIRNNESLNFVWDSNPYLDGFSSSPPTKLIAASTQKKSLIDIIAANHGIPEQDFELTPEIYKTLDTSSLFSKDSYIDLNYTSFVGALTTIDLLKIFKSYPNHLIVNPQPIIQVLLPHRKFIFTTSLVQYATLIRSCKNFVCLASGGATLAAALKKNVTVYYGHGFPETIKHHTNTYIQYGSNNYFRHQLTRVLFKKNQIRIKLSKNK